VSLPLVLALLSLSSGVTAFAGRFEEIKKHATPEELYAFLYDLPKGGDLHNHFGGSGLAETWLMLATDRSRNAGREFYTRTRILDCDEPCPTPLLRYHTLGELAWRKLPECCQEQYRAMTRLSAEEREAWASSVMLDRPGEGREEFFDVIWSRLDGLLKDPELVAELLIENLKLFAAEGVRYIEFQGSPFGMERRDGTPLGADELARIFEDRLQRPDAVETGVAVRFLASVLRFRSDAESEVERTFDFLDRNRSRWVGINLVGREDNDRGHPLRFLEVFRKMRRRYSGIGIALHGGELDEPGQRVRDTLLLGATRIGHAVNLVTDPQTLLFLRQGPYLIETSLVSNQLLEYTPDLSHHPFPEYLRLGVPVCLNTDDRGMWDSSLTDEYYTAVTRFNLSWGEIVRLGEASFKHSFADPETKAELLRGYAAALERFVDKYAEGDWRRPLSTLQPRVSGYARRQFGLGESASSR
jgi:adenosine deaminase CECR1